MADTLVELRHGYTLRDLHQMTAAALRADRSGAMDYTTRRDVAWSAIAEALYAADEPPHRQELIRVGWQAIYAEVRDRYRHHGYQDRDGFAGHGTAPNFAAYWLGLPQVTPSPEDRVVERLALPRLLETLTDGQRQVVATLAAFEGDRPAAAVALGCSEKALNHQLRMARSRCLAAWLGGETPHRVSLRRLDRRNHRGERKPCGTVAAYLRHHRARERCEVCAPVGREYEAARKARGKAGGCDD